MKILPALTSALELWFSCINALEEEASFHIPPPVFLRLILPPSSHSASLYETLLGVPCQRIRNFVHAQEEFDIPQLTLNEWLPKDVGAAGDGKLDTDLAVVAVFAVLLLAVESHR